MEKQSPPLSPIYPYPSSPSPPSRPSPPVCPLSAESNPRWLKETLRCVSGGPYSVSKCPFYLFGFICGNLHPRLKFPRHAFGRKQPFPRETPHKAHRHAQSGSEYQEIYVFGMGCHSRMRRNIRIPPKPGSRRGGAQQGAFHISEL